MIAAQEMTPALLVVDLDGTLLRSDMLHETFWSSLSRDWRIALDAPRQLLAGKAALKAFLAETSKVDIPSLPYNDEVVHYIRKWREDGGRAILVTATNQAIADKIADHVGLFDAVHGSDGETNIKGTAKAEFLAQEYPNERFVYMGDSSADVPVWEKSSKAVTVDASSGLRSRAETTGAAEHIGTTKIDLKAYARSIRPHQWLKNILVFLPMIAGHDLAGMTLLMSILAFLAFSMVASSVYVLNDLLDLSSDRQHPRKCRRPFASGAIPIAHGAGLAFGLLAGGAIMAFVIGGWFVLVMGLYYVLTTTYSLYLKRLAVADICTLAALYTLRIVAGSVASGIAMSVWLFAFSIFFFFALAAVKRQAELVDNAERGKSDITGRGYRSDDLPIIPMMAIASGYVAILILALYVNSLAVLDLYNTPEALFGICFVLLFWISRMVLITHRGQMHDDPVVFAARDRVSQISFLLIIVIAVAGALL